LPGMCKGQSERIVLFFIFAVRKYYKTKKYELF
jgi:hypothetical protein